MPATGDNGYFSERWRRFSAQIPYLPATARLVWQAAPRWMTLWACLLVAQGLLPVGIAYLTRAIVNRVVEMLRTPGRDLSPILPLAIVMAGVLLLGECINALLLWVKVAQSEYVWVRIARIIQEKSTTVRMGFYDSPEFYDRIYRAQNEGPARALNLIESAGSIAQDSITLVGIFAIILPYGAWLPLMLLVSTVPALCVLFYYTVEQHKWRMRRTPDFRKMDYYDSVLTGREAAPEVRVFGLARWFQARYEAICSGLRDERMRLARRQTLGEALAAAASLAAAGAALLPMAYQAFQGRLSLGSLAFVYQVFQSGLRAVRSLTSQLVHVYSHVIFLEDLFRFLNLPAEPRPEAAVASLPARIEGSIVFRGVTFQYPGTKSPILEGFDLSIPAGKKVAILGANGSGKSTLIRLLCRFYEPLQGEIELDGAPLRNFPPERLRREIAVLFQDPMRYSGTVAENIELGDIESGFAEARLRSAARGSGASRFIEGLPDGYEAILGRRFTGGTELSVGEWQQLSLARAYFREAPILILDEPTSAMDPWAEAEWLERFRALAEGRTAIIITHRLTTGLVADTIHLIKDGRIRESGTHDELLARGEEYASAWSRQMEARRMG